MSARSDGWLPSVVVKSALKWPRPHYGWECVIGHAVSLFQCDSKLTERV
ncbi:hypothetical protein HMPREF9584_01240 [Cutibacterium acnes HL092PA1]|nr:hypothetical protein HMPREF9584_01240 [Cutibacterium acnes HL092PA1]